MSTRLGLTGAPGYNGYPTTPPAHENVRARHQHGISQVVGSLKEVLKGASFVSGVHCLRHPDKGPRVGTIRVVMAGPDEVDTISHPNSFE
jgi:hypothetical protein